MPTMYDYITFQATVRDPKTNDDQNSFCAPQAADAPRKDPRAGYTITRDGDTVSITHPGAPGVVTEVPWSQVRHARRIEQVKQRQAAPKVAVKPEVTT